MNAMAKIPFLSRVRTLAYKVSTKLQLAISRNIWNMDLGDDVRISRSAKLDKTNPRGIHIGRSTLISFDVAVLTHDFLKRQHVDTYIGSYCFIGARAMVMPGVRIGDHCVIGAGSVVTTDIPSNSVAVSNPARVIRMGVQTGRWGILDPSFLEADEVSRAISA